MCRASNFCPGRARRAPWGLLGGMSCAARLDAARLAGGGPRDQSAGHKGRWLRPWETERRIWRTASSRDATAQRPCPTWSGCWPASKITQKKLQKGCTRLQVGLNFRLVCLGSFYLLDSFRKTWGRIDAALSSPSVFGFKPFAKHVEKAATRAGRPNRCPIWRFSLRPRRIARKGVVP